MLWCGHTQSHLHSTPCTKHIFPWGRVKQVLLIPWEHPWMKHGSVPTRPWHITPEKTKCKQHVLAGPSFLYRALPRHVREMPALAVTPFSSQSGPQLQTHPIFVSSFSFIASERHNGIRIKCRGWHSRSGGIPLERKQPGEPHGRALQ